MHRLRAPIDKEPIHLRSLTAIVCLFAATPVFSAQRVPKGFENGFNQRVAAIESEAVGSITPDQIAGYEDASDGTRFTVLHIRKTGAAAVWVRFANVRLPEGAALLVYGKDVDSPWLYKNAFNDTAVVPGESAYIEIQCGSECPADLPFDIAEVGESSLEFRPQVGGAEDGASDEVFKGHFRGIDVEYKVRDGLAIMDGDIVLGPAYEMQPPQGDKDRSRNAVGLNFSSFLWTGGRIPYTIDSAVTDQGRILQAMEHWTSMTAGAVKFVPRSSELMYLRIVRGGSCSSSIGMAWLSTMYLSEMCSTGTVIHELGHTLGLYHEHVREDRDKHVRILSQNIVLSALSQFSKMISSTDDIGAYDFNSIMHYSAYTFSLNGGPTIETIPAGVPIGQRQSVSTGDIAAVRRLYGFGYTVPAPSNNAPVPEPAPLPPPPPPPQPQPDPEPPPPPPPAVVSVTITTNPASERVIVDGTSYQGSATFNWTVGTTHTIGAVNRVASGSTAMFVRWSDSGAVTHTITANANTTLYRADFALNHSVSATSSDSNGGQVTISPESQTGYYPSNSIVNLSATPAYGYCFTGWSGLIGGTPSTTALAVTKPYAITAQFARASSFVLSRQLTYIQAPADTYSVSVTGTDGCAWMAESQTSWISVSSERRAGSGTVSYSVSENNTGYLRVGVVVLAGRPFYVVQLP